MKKDSNNKTLKAYRLTPEAIELLEELSKKLGVSRQGVVELAVREYAKTLGVRTGSRAKGK